MHIAFVAMSGVRAWNPEITAAGLTMPGFLERSQTIASLPSLSLLTLAGMTPSTIEVSYHEILDIGELGELPPTATSPPSPRTRPRSRTPTHWRTASGRSGSRSSSAASMSQPCLPKP